MDETRQHLGLSELREMPTRLTEPDTPQQHVADAKLPTHEVVKRDAASDNVAT
jgi:hypothetical protein